LKEEEKSLIYIGSGKEWKNVDLESMAVSYCDYQFGAKPF